MVFSFAGILLGGATLVFAIMVLVAEHTGHDFIAKHMVHLHVTLILCVCAVVIGLVYLRRTDVRYLGLFSIYLLYYGLIFYIVLMLTFMMPLYLTILAWIFVGVAPIIAGIVYYYYCNDPPTTTNSSHGNTTSTRAGLFRTPISGVQDDVNDFRTNELRIDSVTVLIPEEEESSPQEEQEEEVEENVNENFRDVEAEGRHLWSCFGPFYDNYCQRMLFFDRQTTSLLKDIADNANAGSQNDLSSSIPSSRSVSKKFTSPLRCLSLKKFEHPQDDTEQLQQHQPENDPYLDLETSYVSQLCLTWEALHCQYTQLTTTSQSENNSKCYNHRAKQFQQFQDLLQRFIETEPFKDGFGPEIYAHTRNTFSKLLQVPNILGQDRKDMTTEEESEMLFVEAPDLIRIIESSILTFQMFVKMDKKKKSNGVRNIFGGQNQMVTPLQQRKMKLKELWKKRKGGKKNQWPATQEEVELLLALIDVKVISRVLRMVKITKEQLFWSEEKMKKLHVSAATGKLQRDPSPILFPC